ncbi:MAG: transposase [Ruminiclostridium sp.]
MSIKLNQRVEETISAFDFIKRLIIHIPDTEFRMIRYYGIYSKKHKSYGKMIMMFNKQQLKIQQMMNRWQLSIISDFHHNPLNCPCCNCEMKLLEHHFP